MSGTKNNTLDRRGLIKDLQSQGFTYREANKIVSSIIQTIVNALKRKETVELPFGKLLAKKNPEEISRWQFGKIARWNRYPYRISFIGRI